MSDHLPVSITLCYSSNGQIEYNEVMKRIAWNKVPKHEITEKYTVLLEEIIISEMSKMLGDEHVLNTAEEVESTVDILTEYILCSHAQRVCSIQMLGKVKTILEQYINCIQ